MFKSTPCIWAISKIEFEVISYSQKVVGRGGSIITIKAKNLLTGSNIPKTFSDKDNFPPADITTTGYDYLYNDGLNYFFMNNSTFEQVELGKEVLDGAELFLQDGDRVLLQEFNGKPINVNLEYLLCYQISFTLKGFRNLGFNLRYIKVEQTLPYSNPVQK